MTFYPFPPVWRPALWQLDVQAPAGEPVTLAELKAHLEVEHDDDDALIAGLGEAAREHVEGMTGRALVTQTRVLRLARLPDAAAQMIELPGGEIQSVTSVAYLDPDGVERTLSGADWELWAATRATTGRLGLKPDAAWPALRAHGFPVAITYVAGWAAAGSPADYGANVPATLKQAIKMVAYDLYERRAVQHDFQRFVNPMVADLCARWKVSWVA